MFPIKNVLLLVRLGGTLEKIAMGWWLRADLSGSSVRILAEFADGVLVFCLEVEVHFVLRPSFPIHEMLFFELLTLPLFSRSRRARKVWVKTTSKDDSDFQRWGTTKPCRGGRFGSRLRVTIGPHETTSPDADRAVGPVWFTMTSRSPSLESDLEGIRT